MSAQDLTFWSFVDAAVERVHERLPGIDPEAMRLVLTLYRVTNMAVCVLESVVHRPRGWSYPRFRLLFTLWVAGPMEAKRAAELSGMSRQAVSSLVNTLHRDGLVVRTVHPVIPPKVEYRRTDLGDTLGMAFCGVWEWAAKNRERVDAARAEFDRRTR